MNHRGLHEREQRAIDRFGDQAMGALALIVDASAALGATLDVGEAIDAVERLLCERDVDWCSVQLTSAETEHLPTSFAEPEVAAAFAQLQLLVQTSGESVVISGEDSSSARLATSEADRVRAVLGSRTLSIVSLSTHGLRLGTMTTLARTGNGPELAVIEEIARRLGAAVRSCNLYRQSVSSVVRRDDALASVAHDLRGPLNVLTLVLRDLVELPIEDPRTTKSSLEVARRAAARMSGLLSDLLDLAQIEGDRPSLRLESCNPRSLAEETIALFEPMARQRRVSLLCEIPRDVPNVRCDRERVLRVLENLVGNSLKFTPPGKHIALTTCVVDDTIAFQVVDTGVGIRHEDLPHVFERFCSANPREGSTGLGLAIAKAFIEAHGGRIWADSQPGVGTTVTFTLPREETRADSSVDAMECPATCSSPGRGGDGAGCEIE